jgi:hypothetical protein
MLFGPIGTVQPAHFVRLVGRVSQHHPTEIFLALMDVSPLAHDRMRFAENCSTVGDNVRVMNQNQFRLDQESSIFSINHHTAPRQGPGATET